MQHWAATLEVWFWKCLRLLHGQTCQSITSIASGMVCGGFVCFRIESRDLLWTANVCGEAVIDTKVKIDAKEVNNEAQSGVPGT